MRYFFFALIIMFAISAKANDTLTRAQVYNYNIGDTFDYYEHSTAKSLDGTINDSSFRYSRIVISNIYWSADSLTKYIVKATINPTPILFDTLEWGQGDPSNVDTFIIAPLPDYFGKESNLFGYYQPPNSIQSLFSQNLGETIHYSWLFAEGIWETDSLILIYYSGDSGTYGTPYTAFPNGINNLTDLYKGICLYPSVNNGSFTIDISRNSQLPIDFSLFDITGKRTKQLSIINTRTEANFNDLNSGLYIWKASFNGFTIQTGKFVIQ